jgi:hypothetical protein
MKRRHLANISYLTAAAAVAFSAIYLLQQDIHADPISFETQVKPILNKHCLKCHGGVKKSGGLSLISREEALAPAKSGKASITPGHPEQSELIRRLLCDDPDERMPQDAPPLSKTDIDILTTWVKQGAKWETHWAYKPVEAVKIPGSDRRLSFFGDNYGSWAKNDIDRFILHKLREKNLQPSAEAPKSVLLRRLSLDLTGLPAPEQLANRFLNDDSPQAYEWLVDSLLAQASFGERWASIWLDLARYSDSKGYEVDSRRDVWRYRDWVIRAFNRNLPYDEFLRRQMAGDLIAASSEWSDEQTDELYLATTFHRLTSTNDEGGSDNEEFRTAAVIDRVSTVWEGVLGTTFACAQCHGHPYDPIRMEEYYGVMAFFNNTRDEDTREDYPVLRHFSAEQLQRLEQLRSWVKTEVSPEKAREIYTFLRTWQPSLNSLRADSMVNADLYAQGYMGLRHKGSARMKGVELSGRHELLFRYFSSHAGGRLRIRLDRPDGPLLLDHVLAATENSWKISRVSFREWQGVHDLFFSYENPRISPSDLGVQFDWLRLGQSFPGAGKPGFQEQQDVFFELLNAAVESTPVLFENPADMHRPTHIFDRGNWLTPTAVVQPGLPAIFRHPKADSAADRAGFADWLTSTDNPLTSRTIVNRLWAELFGRGIAFTLEDLGSQGIPPTHPELLDWLAWQFMHQHDWSIKDMLREMVLSATYRQDSRTSPGAIDADPYNEWYGRGPRVRLSAEQLRDQALAVSGLLSNKMYGPPVMPFQPPGIWKTPYSGEEWKISEGEDKYRRSIYTFWKRSAPYPSAMIFDSAAKDVCAARRVRTNTPLQALVTLNDEVFVEAAGHLARWMCRQKGSPGDQIGAGYARVTGWQAGAAKVAVLKQLYDTSLASFRSGDSDAAVLPYLPDEGRNAQTAAMAVVANALLNLDEVMVKN